MKPQPAFSRAPWLYAAVGLLTVATASFAGSSKALRLPPVSTSGGDRLPGKFVWADLVTDDVPAVRRFYGQLFGWIYQDIDGYTIAKNQDRPLAGFVQRSRPEGDEAKPRWFGYISVKNVTRASNAVTQQGGKVLAEPQRFAGRGEQAVFVDPEGALFGVIKSSSGDPEDFLPESGDWIWVQLLSRDARKACEFYTSVAGYKVVENSETDRPGDFVLTSEGYARAVVSTIPSELGEVKPNWLPFVCVLNVSESVAKAKELGGTVLIPPQDTGPAGHVAVVADPTGAAFGMLEWNPEEAKGAQ